LRRGVLQSLKFLGFLLLGVILLWLAFRKTDFSKLAADLKEADYSWLFLSVLFGFIGYVSRARRWMLLIHPLGYKPTMVNSFYALMSGYLANLALPRIGEITRCVALGKREKIPVDQLFGTVIVERTIDFLSLLTIMFAVLLTSSDKVGEFVNDSIFIPLQDKISSVFGETWILFLTLFILFVASIFFVIKYRKRLRNIRFFAKMFSIARGIIDGLKTITNLERKWEFIFHTLVIWLSYALMTWVVVFAIPSTSHITFGESFFLLVIGGIAMSAPVQSGFGVFHYTISRALVVIENVSLEDGLVYSLLTHESQLIFVAIVGTISFFLIFRKHRKES
jgi:uncharacterized protein (TIRG00374 family)